MTTTRALAAVLSALLLLEAASAAPPSSLTGKFVSLNGNRLEFADEEFGSDSGLVFEYSYGTVSALSSSLSISYLSSGRQRGVTLNFLGDGTPAGYTELDLTPTNPPTPPIFRTGSFEIGELEVEPPPPTESSAPSSLVGLFIEAAEVRYEFLTAEVGRRFRPGASEDFLYRYDVVGEKSAEVEIEDEASGDTVELELCFDEEGGPAGFVLGELSGDFSIGTNLHLADLLIGKDASGLVGNDFYGAEGRHQRVVRRSTSPDAVAYAFALENEGVDDSFALRASRGSGNFRVAYFSEPSGENVTAAITAGLLRTGELGHRERAAFSMKVTPERRRGTLVARVEARSLSVEEAWDAVQSVTRVRVAKGKPAPSPKPVPKPVSPPKAAKPEPPKPPKPVSGKPKAAGTPAGKGKP